MLAFVSTINLGNQLAEATGMSPAESKMWVEEFITHNSIPTRKIGPAITVSGVHGEKIIKMMVDAAALTFAIVDKTIDAAVEMAN